MTQSGINGKYETIKECSDIGYLCGVILGDGFISLSKRGEYIIGLGVRDKDFAENFRKCIVNITGSLPKLHAYGCLQKLPSGGSHYGTRYRVAFQSKPLYFLFKYNMKFYADKYPKQFLKGFFDSEGCVMLSKSLNRRILAYQKTKKTLVLIKKMLQSLNIFSSIYVKKDMMYVLRISADSTQKYIENIGFSINRKQQRLLGNIAYYQTEKYRKKEDFLSYAIV